MTIIKIILGALGVFAILLSFLGALVTANNPGKKPIKFYRICFWSGTILLAIAIGLHLFI